MGEIFEKNDGEITDIIFLSSGVLYTQFIGKHLVRNFPKVAQKTTCIVEWDLLKKEFIARPTNQKEVIEMLKRAFYKIPLRAGLNPYPIDWISFPKFRCRLFNQKVFLLVNLMKVNF